MLPYPLRTCALALVAVAALAGCGGGGGGGRDTEVTVTPRGTDVPESALQSVPGLIAYMKELIAGTSETTEPVFVGNAVLPTDETSEPAPVN